MRVWLATSTFGTSLRRPSARIARVEPAEVDAGRRELPLGEAHRALAPVAPSWVDQPARDERRAVAVVGDGGDQPVVLVAEVEAAARPVADRPVGRQRRERRHAEHAGDDVGPRRIRRPTVAASAAAGRPADPKAEGAHQHLGVEHLARRPPRPVHRRRAVASRAHRPGVARRQDRLRQHEADAAAVGLGEPDRRGRGTRPPHRRTARRRAGWRRRGSSPRTAARGTAGCRRRRRSAAVPSRTRGRRPWISSAPGTSADGDARAGRRRHPSASRRRPRASSAAGGGREEASVAARRVEHPHRPVARRRRRPRTCRRSCARRPGRRGRRACTRRPTACACAWSIPSSAHRERRVRVPCRTGSSVSTATTGRCSVRRHR